MAVPDSNFYTLEKLRREANTFRQGLIAKITSSGYAYDVRMFARWGCGVGLETLPASSDTLALYLTHLLVHEQKKITTARRRRCAIIHQHRALGLPSPDATEIRELLKGAQRIRREKPRQMRPITVEELRRMSARLARTGSAAAMRDRAILVLGFATALRRSNLAALTLEDVEFCEQGLTVRVDHEKNDQEAKGRLIAVLRGRHVDSDPVRVLRAWLRVRGTNPGPLFTRVSQWRRGEALSGDSICRIVKRCVALIGLDPGALYGAHSLRAACVTAAGENDVGVLRIGAYTGQSGPIVQRYFRRVDLWKNSVSGKLGL